MVATTIVRINDKVAFLDRWGGAHEGTIKQFHAAGQYGRGKAVTVTALDGDGTHIVPFSSIAPFGSPRANDMLAPKQYLVAGTLVRVTLPAGKTIAGIGNGDLGIVLADKGQRVNVAKLGGFGGQYLRTGHTALTVVDPAEVIKG